MSDSPQRMFTSSVTGPTRVRPRRDLPFINLQRLRDRAEEAVQQILEQLYDDRYPLELRRFFFFLLQLDKDSALDLFEPEYAAMFDSGCTLQLLFEDIVGAYNDDALVFVYQLETGWKVLISAYSYAEVTSRLSSILPPGDSTPWLCVSTDLTTFLDSFDTGWVGWDLTDECIESCCRDTGEGEELSSAQMTSAMAKMSGMTPPPTVDEDFWESRKEDYGVAVWDSPAADYKGSKLNPSGGSNDRNDETTPENVGSRAAPGTKTR